MYALSCESTCDLTKEQLCNRKIEFACFHLRLNGTEYMDDFWTRFSPEEFYQLLDEGADVATAQVNIAEYLEHFTSILERGEDILHVTLSSGLSGTINSATRAADIARERFPDRKIYIVDSLCASSGYGLLMTMLADMRDEGISIDESYEWINSNRLHIQHLFFSTNLRHYMRGGRITRAEAILGGVLNICPVLNVDLEGRLVPRHKVRGKRKAIQDLATQMENLAENGFDYDKRCYICHSNCEADACSLAEIIENKFPKLKEKVSIYPVGTVIGSHTGPGTVALFFWGTERKEENA